MQDDKRYCGYSKYLESWIKRALDIGVCTLLLFPVLIILVFASLSILIWEGRPVFFTHYRTGKNGKIFWLPKLRTLRADINPYELSAKTSNKHPATPIGRILRKHKLDELPQLFSVMKGYMSLVGPRPELPNIVQTYRSLHRKRLLAKPGLTGLWQVLGDHSAQIHKNIKYDLYYLRKASLWLDIKILLMTILFVLHPK